MNELNLSKRLQTVANFVPNQSHLADIGSDHAYLPAYLCLEEIIEFAVAGEVNEGPFQSAKQLVEKLNLTDKISVRKGDGLEVITDEDNIDCITICGMGGALIADILQRGHKKLANVKRLVLQPNVVAEKVRRWLYANGWQLIAEQIVEEDGKIYEVLVAERGDVTAPYDEKSLELQFLLGPFLLREKNEVFIKKWRQEMEIWKRIVKQLEQAEQTDERMSKRNQWLEQIKRVEEVLS